MRWGYCLFLSATWRFRFSSGIDDDIMGEIEAPGLVIFYDGALAERMADV
jgi:hypothetical protein